MARRVLNAPKLLSVRKGDDRRRVDDGARPEERGRSILPPLPSSSLLMCSIATSEPTKHESSEVRVEVGSGNSVVILRIEDDSPPLSPARLMRGKINVREAIEVVSSAVSFDCTCSDAMFVVASVVLCAPPPGILESAIHIHIEMPPTRGLLDRAENNLLSVSLGTLNTFDALLCGNIHKDVDATYLVVSRISYQGSLVAMTYKELMHYLPKDTVTWRLIFKGTIRTRTLPSIFAPVPSLLPNLLILSQP